MRTFYNTIAPEITVLSKQEIVDMISNTFKTEVVSDEDNFVTLKSEWIFLKDTEENVPSVESRGFQRKIRKNNSDRYFCKSLIKN